MFYLPIGSRRFRLAAPVAAIALLGVLAAPTVARAQIGAAAAIGQFAHWTSQGLIKGTDSDYDPVNDVFLVVGSCYTGCSSGAVYGRFVNRLGVPVTSFFAIATSGNGHFPRARYGAGVDGGRGGFMVSWVEERGGGNRALVRPVRFNLGGGVGEALGDATVVSDSTSFAWLETGAALGYSPVSNRFLIAWMSYAPFAVKARGLDVTGAVISPIRQLSAGYGENPAVAWNSTTNEFGVSFSVESGKSGFSAFAKVNAADGTFTRESFNQIAGIPRITDIAYNPATNRWVMVWIQALFGVPGWETYVAEIDSTGAVQTMGLATKRWVGYNSVAVAHNPVSGTFLLASIPPSDEVSALELNRNGLPMSSVTAIGPGQTTRYARATANSDVAEWVVTFSNNYESGRVFPVLTTSTGGGTTGSLPAYGSGSDSGGSTPPPSTPPPSSGCTTPDPFASIGGGTCQGNNTWTYTGVPSTPPPSTPPPSTPPPSSSGCTTPDPFAAIGGGTCVGNNSWVPGGGGSSTPPPSTPPPSTPPPSSGGSLTCTATGSSPVPGWVCVGNGWVPPNHPLASQASAPPSTPPPTPPPSSGGSLSVCSTTPSWAIGGGWVRVGAGDWVPATHPLASQAVCRAQ